MARRIVAGEIESPIRPLADSVALLEVMDAIREQVGIPLPGTATVTMLKRSPSGSQMNTTPARPPRRIGWAPMFL